MKILLSGADGQLGLAIQERFPGEVIALSRPAWDIASLEATRRALDRHRPEAVINAAAFTAVDAAESQPEEAYRVNALAPARLAAATAERGLPLLHFSTDYVFDGASRAPCHEFHRPAPLSVYGASKLAGEEAVRGLNPRHYIVRTAWLHHPRRPNFLRTMVQLAQRKEEVRVIADRVGSPTSALHLADALAPLLESGDFGLHHLVNGGQASWCDLTVYLYQKMNLPTRTIPIPAAEYPQPAPRPAHSVLTTLRDPPWRLPSWQEGVDLFVARFQAP
ncbi:MAG: dTDP-4-dehydrorhamnose reductase [Magnetococcales bacterium]|nr:dTDP-4-dehydrorhamnose reductase [Magnetococcales bacterium]